MPVKNRVRVGGSGFTVYTFGGQLITFAQQIAYTSPTPVGPGPVAIQPMDEPYPVQVITPAASGMGSLTLNLYEIYNSKVWDRLGARINGSTDNNQSGTSFGNSFLTGAVDLVDVFIRIAEQDVADLMVVKFVRPPNLGGQQIPAYTEEYHNVVITNVLDGEQTEVGTMEVIKQVTLAFTHLTRNGKRSKAWDYRDRPLPNVASG